MAAAWNSKHPLSVTSSIQIKSNQVFGIVQTVDHGHSVGVGRINLVQRNALVHVSVNEANEAMSGAGRVNKASDDGVVRVDTESLGICGTRRGKNFELVVIIGKERNCGTCGCGTESNN